MSELYKIEEPSFINITQIFWQKKRLIFITVLLTTLLTLVYSLTHKPTYEARGLISAPSQIETSLLNIASIASIAFINPQNENGFNSTELYSLFSEALRSDALRKLFIKQNIDVKEIHVFEDTRIKPFRYLVRAKAKNPEMAKKYLKDYVAYVNKQALINLPALIQKRKKILLNSLNEQIHLLREVVNTSKDLYGARVTKAISIAKKNGIKNIVISSPGIAEELIQVYEKNYRLYSNSFISIENAELFVFSSDTLISNYNIKSVLLNILLFGVLGGFILGFFIAVMRVEVAPSNPVV